MKILLLIFLVLVASVWIFVRPFSDNADRAEEAQPLFAFAQQDVAAFQINHFISGLFFKKDGQGWLVKRVKNELAKSVEAKEGKAGIKEDTVFSKADPVAVAKALTVLFLLKIGEPVAAKPEKLPLFQINRHALHLIFFNAEGKELGRLHIGKEGPDLFSSFIKKPASDAVYLADQNLRGLFLRNFEDWLGD